MLTRKVKSDVFSVIKMKNKNKQVYFTFYVLIREILDKI